MSRSFLLMLAMLACLSTDTGRAEPPSIRFVDQGPAWTTEVRARYYELDQGSQLIPKAWLAALLQANGKPFLDGTLTRYGYLANPRGSTGLPVGFSLAPSAQGPMVGMTCAACHTRDVTLKGETYRIDGAPSFGDFGRFVFDLDAAVRATLADDATLKAFTDRVLGDRANDQAARISLRDAVDLWAIRLHTLVSRSFPTERPWGPSRMDAMGLIYDFLTGTDIGPAPTYLLPDNILPADAPARYPFLWNEFHQDFNQWGGFQKNGTDTLALARNLGEVFGVFATYHPKPARKPSLLNVDYISDNSGNIPGLQAAEGLVKIMGPPAWPWTVDKNLAAKGKAVFDRPKDQGGCIACHGVARGVTRDDAETWRTPVLDVGTDTRAWRTLLRSASTGILKGATIPGYYGPLKDRDLAINILKLAVVGPIEDVQAANAPPHQSQPASSPGAEAAPNPSTPVGSAPIVVNGYEARVLQGIWAAAPYLHNGSVPTLAALLEPPARRPKRFVIGPAYDIQAVGLARDQQGFDLETTGCDRLDSGDSNCGHDYGTTLSPDDKAALLEYLKIL